MNQDVKKTPETQGEASPAVSFANLCAQIGERQYLILKLSAEITELTRQIDEIKPKP